MPYAQLDTNGNVTGIFANPQDFPTTLLDDTDPKIVAYLNPPVAVPVFVSNYQARAQLIADNNFASVDATIRNSGNQGAIQAWDYANNFYRVSPFIDLFKAATPYNTEALVDQFFIKANAQK